MKTIGYLLYGLAFAVLAYNLGLKYLSWRDGKFRSWVFAVTTILALLATVVAGGSWWVFTAFLVADWLLPFFFARPER